MRISANRFILGNEKSLLEVIVKMKMTNPVDVRRNPVIRNDPVEVTLMTRKILKIMKNKHPIIKKKRRKVKTRRNRDENRHRENL